MAKTYTLDEVRLNMSVFQTKKKKKKRGPTKQFTGKQEEHIDKILETIFNYFEAGQPAIKRLNIFGFDFDCGFFDHESEPLIFDRLETYFAKPDITKETFTKENIEILQFGKTLSLKKFLKDKHTDDMSLLRLQMSLFSIV